MIWWKSKENIVAVAVAVLAVALLLILIVRSWRMIYEILLPCYFVFAIGILIYLIYLCNTF
uniref:Uncharacterized protein n=1 Tax=Picea sitchensis TaxID=3332 RepID=D5AD84_PICSI|nr:unknown [Picea sitchensis]